MKFPKLIFFNVGIILSIFIVQAITGWHYPLKTYSEKSVLPYALILESRRPELNGGPINGGLKLNPFDNIFLEAKSAYVFEINSQKPIFALNPDVQLPLASLVKLMTALVAKENLPKDAVVAISREAIGQEGDEGLFLNERWRASDLLDAMLVSSSNDAAFAIAQEIEKKFSKSDADFPDVVSIMNRWASKIGLANVYFLNPTGLDVSKSMAGGYGSARDVAKLAAYLFLNDPSLLGATRESQLDIFSFDGKKHSIKNTDKIVSSVPGLIAGKTGFTDLAGGNLMIIFDMGFNHPIISVVLGSSFEGRFNDTMKIIEATFKYYANAKSS